MVMVDEVISDDRLGKRGLGILLLPQGFFFGSLQVGWAWRSVFSDDFYDYGSVNGFLVWLLMLIAAFFFTVVVASALLCFFKAGTVVRQARVRQEKVEFVSFWGRRTEFLGDELLSVESIKSNPIVLLDLLSKKKENWRVTTRSGKVYFLNGEIFRDDNFMAALKKLRGLKYSTKAWQKVP